MSRHRRTGRFAQIVKIVASVSAVLAWTGHLIANASGAVNPAQPQSVGYDHNKLQDGGRNLPPPDGSVKVALGEESCPSKKVPVDTNCNIFYILVSTIDGKMSALDLHNQGSVAWSVEADSRPLYSSSLASMEMTRDGKKMRLIPSLDGALYQYDGEKVEAIPMSAETLLSSTYRLSDDSMIVGSKDLRNYGVDVKTGEVQFTCSSEGCSSKNVEAKSKILDGNMVLVLTRSTQVVRSVDIKNGNEKWNFSVGQHQVHLHTKSEPSEIDDEDDDNDDLNIPFFSNKEECPTNPGSANDEDYEHFLRLLVPEGRVVALSKGDSNQVEWEHKFDSPIAKAWLLRNGKLESMSLFDGRHVPTLNTMAPEDVENDSLPQPLLYIGSHQKLLYIQPSPQMESVLKTFTKRRIGHVIDPKIKVAWRPYLNTASVRTPIFGGNSPQLKKGHHVKGSKESTSLTVWHEDYPFDTGYFLYPEFKDSRSNPRGRQVMMIEDLHKEEGSLMDTLPASLWIYWKEVIAISITMSLAVHLILTRFLHHGRLQSQTSLDSLTNDASKNSNSSQGLFVASDSSPTLEDKANNAEEYVSRFATDFECLHCLGRGGFGVVFEAVNKVDDMHYAVKRTMLPKSDGAKEKVLREVRALAKLEHIGIVRYFNAWVESPPAGWQEERDKKFQLSDASGPTSFSYSAHHQVSIQQSSHQLQYVSKAQVEKQEKKINPHREDLSVVVKTQEVALEQNSIMCGTNMIPDQIEMKKTDSGEFSVHSNWSGGVGNSHSGSEFSCLQNNIFSFGFDSEPGDESSANGSLEDSKSSIPFSNYTSNSSVAFSQKNDFDLTGDSVVFENSSKGHSINSDIHDNGLSGGSIVFEAGSSTAEESIVFEESVASTHKVSSDKNPQRDLSIPNKNQRLNPMWSSHGNEDLSEDKKTQSEPSAKYFLYIQMQLYRKDTLKEWLSNNTLNRDRQTILDIFDQIVCAVDYVHSCGLMHRDLKPSNIFFSADEIIKVGDFGLVTALSVQEPESGSLASGRHTAEVGTTLYMSPEQIARKPYDLKIDIFSLGLIFLELWIPFSTQMERIRTLQEAKKQIFPARFTRELPAESELVYKMTSLDPAMRPTTQEILDHPLFKDLAPSRVGTRLRKRTVSENNS